MKFFLTKLKFTYLLLGLSATAGLFFAGSVLADTEIDSATVNATIPAVCGNGVVEGDEQCDDGNLIDGDGCSSTCQTEGGGGGGDSWPPAISNVVEDPGVTTTSVSWNATDFSGIRVCYFTYGLDTNYDNSATVSGSYLVNLTGLSAEMTYYYRIRCLDNNFNDAVYTDSFTTLAAEDDQPPVITVLEITEDVTSAAVLWEATDNVAVAECSFVYDSDEQLEPYDFTWAVYEPAVNQYRVDLDGLTPSTLYFWKIVCVDEVPNSATELGTLKTLDDVTPPPDVSDFTASPGDKQIFLNWDYSDTISDFSHYTIRRDIFEPADINDGVLVAEIADISTRNYTDSGLVNLTEYFYKIFAVDTSDNNSNGVWDSAVPRAGSETGACGDGLDNDLDGARDCADSDCADDPLCEQAMVEICDNGIDDDGDGAVDCDDPDCAAHEQCLVEEPGLTECDDGIDNDQDGLIDLEDPGCENEQDNSELDQEPAVAVLLDDARVMLAERTILAQMIDGAVSSLPGDQLSVLMDRGLIDEDRPRSIELFLNGDRYDFVLDALNNLYYSDVLVPAVGTYSAVVEIRYERNEMEMFDFRLNSLPMGVVQGSAGGEPITEARVTLISVDYGERPWVGTNYRQENPQLTGAQGRYGFVVPAGTYKLMATADGYRDYESAPFIVENNVVNRNISMIFLPPPLEEVIDEQAPFMRNVRNVTENLGQKAGMQLAILKELADNPAVERVSREVVAPAVLTASVAAVVPSLWSILLPLLRFLFLQPLLLLGRRKRESWGMVYNSYTKLPVDLAVVRLLDAKSGRVERSRVTDKQGRYLFIVDPGEYRIRVMKQGYTFPSELLKDVKTDRELVDIYHGELLRVSGEKVSVTPNIPLDPIGETRKPGRIKWERYWRVFQHVIAVVGIIATAVALYISPVWYLWLFLAVHITLYILFFVYVRPKKPKGWGIVYDKHNKNPVSKAIVRLFSKDYNKLVSSQVTDKKGRYSFLVGPNEYYITVEKPGYVSQKSENIDLKKSDKGLIKRDFSIQKQ